MYCSHLLRRFAKNLKQIKCAHSILITGGYFGVNSKRSNTLLYNDLIRSHADVGDARGALRLFTQMLTQEVPADTYTFPSLIKSLPNSFSFSSCIAKSLHSQVIKLGICADPFVQTSFLNLYAQHGHLSDARRVFDEITHPSIVSTNAMLDAFARNGDMDSCVSLFQSMQERDVFSWTSVINGFGKNSNHTEAIRVFRMMMMMDGERENCSAKPNEATFVTVLSSLANSSGEEALIQGKQVHAYLTKNQEELTVFLGTALTSFYGKMGILTCAMSVFRQMKVKRVCAWNALISSLASNGEENRAIEMFQKMTLRPNEVTFVAVLTACARAKLVEEGLGFFRSMVVNYGISPIMEHYGCIVDLLSRAGMLEEAAELLGKMTFEPHGSVLGSFLSACKVHGAVELGTEIGRRALELQPRHCGRHVAVWGILAVAEKWALAAHIRQRMARAQIEKIRAYSFIN